MKKRRSSCTVRWEETRFGVDAVLYARDGRSINSIRFGTHPLTATQRKWAEKRPLRGCRELSHFSARGVSGV